MFTLSQKSITFMYEKKFQRLKKYFLIYLVHITSTTKLKLANLCCNEKSKIFEYYEICINHNFTQFLNVRMNIA